MTSHTFKEASENDLPIILKWTEFLMSHEALDDKIELPLVNNITELVEQWLRDLLSDPNSLFILAIDENDMQPKGLIIGYAQLQQNNFTIYNMHGIIQMVWVEKQERQKGLALQLVTHMENTFKNLNIPYCEIQYSTSNKEAEGFWAKAGYQITSISSRKIF